MKLLAAAIAVVAMSAPAIGQDRTVEVIKTADFLKLPEDFQGLYIAGIIDGMAYVMYNNSDPSHDSWVACVRKAPLVELVADVTTFLDGNTEYLGYPVSYSVAVAIGKRRPC